MSVQVACRACGETFDAENRYAGRQANCPICGATNDVPLRSTFVGVDIDATERDQLRRVGYGLMTILIIIAILLVDIVLIVFAGTSNSFELMMVLQPLQMPLVIGTRIGMLVALIMCAGAPERSRARSLAAWSALASGLGLIAIMLMAANPYNFVMIIRLSILNNVMMLVETILFLLFVARTATFLDDKLSASRAMTVLYVSGILLTGAILISLFVDRGVDGLPTVVGIILGVTFFVLMVLVLVRYVGAIAGLRNTVRRTVG